MNTWSKVRLGFVASAFLMQFLRWNQGERPPEAAWIPPFCFVFGMLMTVFGAGLLGLSPYTAPEWRYPSWSISPLNLAEPLQFYHLCSFVVIAIGAGRSVRKLFLGLPLIASDLIEPAIGAGVFVGVYLCTFVFRGKMKRWSHKGRESRFTEES